MIVRRLVAISLTAVTLTVAGLAPAQAAATKFVHNSWMSDTFFRAYAEKGCKGHKERVQPGHSVTFKVRRVKAPINSTMFKYNAEGQFMGKKKMTANVCYAIYSDGSSDIVVGSY